MNKTDYMQQMYAVGSLCANHSEIHIRLLTLQVEGKVCILPTYTRQADDGTWY